MNVLWNQSYSPAEAERSKFIPLDTSTISSYPLSGRGKNAVLTYQVGSESGSTSAAPTYITPVLSNLTEIKSIVLSNYTVTSINFNPVIQTIELYNNGSNICYFAYETLTLNNLTAVGMPLGSECFYSIDRTITTFCIGSLSGSDVRIFGHYKG